MSTGHALVLVVACSIAVAPLAFAEPPPEKALAAALARLEDKPGDSDALREVLNLSQPSGGIRGLVERYEARTAERPKDVGVKTVLGHFLREAGRCPEAIAVYDVAVTLGNEAEASVGKARCQLELEQVDPAFASYRAAASRASGDGRIAILQELLSAALAAERAEVADETYAALVKAAPRDLFLRVEIAKKLADAGRLTLAVDVWKDIRSSAGGDQKIALLATTELGRLLVRTGDIEGAISLYTQALSSLPSEHWAEPDLRDGLVDAYRRAGRLADYVAALEKNQRTYPELVILARLFEETGEDQKAVTAYRKAVKERPRNIEAQDALIRIVQRIGSDQDLEAEYRRLAKATPGDPTRELDLADLLLRTGRTKAGFDLLKELTKRYSNDTGALASIGEMLIRYDGAATTIEQIYAQLLRLEPNEEAHAVALGEYYFSIDQREKAIETWGRIERTMKNPSQAQLVLARLFADHDMAVEADKHYRTAIELAPKKVKPQKSYALFLERVKRGADAIVAWEATHSLLEPPDTESRREARKHIIELAVGLGQLDARLAVWRADPSRDAQLLLAEGLISGRRFADVESLLAGAGKSDVESLLYLDEAYEKLNRAADSLRVLESLLLLDKANAAVRLRRMAELAASLGRTPDAERYARKAVELAPTDGAAQEYLGDVLAAQAREDDALLAYRRAVSLEPGRMALLFKMGRLLERTGRDDEAGRVLTGIVEKSSNPEDILAAGRSLSGLGGMDALGRLESILVRLSGAQPKKVYYRDLLIDVYATSADRWKRVSRAQPAEAAKGLRRIGDQSLRPLLESLQGSDASLRSRVLRLILATRPAAAAPALVRRLGGTDRVLVFQSLVALGYVGASTGLEVLRGLATGRDGGLAVAAVWALGTSRDPGAAKILHQLGTGAEARSDRALPIALALGARGRPDGVDTALEILRGGDVVARPAAAWALGAIGDDRALTPLLDRLAAEAGPTRAAIGWALGALGKAASVEPLLRALWSSPDDAAVLASALRSIATGKRPDPADIDRTYLGLVDLQESRIAVDRAFPVLFVESPRTAAAEDAQAGAAFLQRHGPAVRSALLAALAATDEQALRTVMAAIVGQDDLVLGPVFEETPIPQAWRADIDTAASIVLTHGAPSVRSAAATLLGFTRGPAGAAALSAGLSDELRSVALASVQAIARRGKGGTPDGSALLVGAARGGLGESWAGRAAVCRALPAIGAVDAAATSYLMAAATDSSPAVRVEAIRALPPTSEARAVLIRALEDSDPEVVTAAIEAAQKQGISEARPALTRLVEGANPALRLLAARALQK